MESIEALLTQVAKKRKLDPTVKGLDSLISALRGGRPTSASPRRRGIDIAGARLRRG